MLQETGNAMGGETRIMRLPEVAAATGLGRESVRQLERAGQFPRRRLLGARAVGWLAADVARWINERPVAGPRTGVSIA